jgi:hypothetical protein
MLVGVEEQELLAEMEQDLLVVQEEMVAQDCNPQLLEQQHTMLEAEEVVLTKVALQVDLEDLEEGEMQTLLAITQVQEPQILVAVAEVPAA